MAKRETPLVTMSFGEHLEELRRRLFRSLLVIVAATLLALTVQKPLLRMITQPHRSAMAGIQLTAEARSCAREVARARVHLEAIPPQQGRRLHDAVRVSSALTEQLAAARNEPSAEARLEALVNAVELLVAEGPQEEVQAFLAQRLFTLVEKLPHLMQRADELGPRGVSDPLTEAGAEVVEIHNRMQRWEAATPGGTEVSAVTLEQLVDELSRARSHLNRIIDSADDQRLAQLMDPELALTTLSYPEYFFSTLRVCLIAGLVIGLPWMTFEIWFFIAGGLYHMERNAVFPFIPLSLVMLILGGLFAYWVLVPVGLGYLGSYGDPELVQPSFTLGRYLSLVIAMLVGMGLVFQLPLLMVFLTRAGLVRVDLFRRYRRMCLLGALVVGAMLTPPDVVTQVLMAVPLAILYEAGIFASAFFERRRERAEQEAADNKDNKDNDDNDDARPADPADLPASTDSAASRDAADKDTP